MRDNPYDFEETVSDYAFPVKENWNKAVTASNLIKAFLFMDKILKIFSMYKNTSVSLIKTNTLLSIPYTFIHKRPGIDIPGLHFLEILDFILSSLTILHSLHGEYEETYRPAVPARPCILHLTKINRAPEWRDYSLHKRYVQEKRTI